MIIRNALNKDLVKCEKLSKMSELLWPSSAYYTADYLDKYLLGNDGCFLVVEENSKVIGYLLGEKLKAGGTIIWSLGIEKKHRGKGIGSLLLKKFEENIIKDGYKWIYLVGRADNENLKHFYIKNGFSVGKNNIEYEKYL